MTRRALPAPRAIIARRIRTLVGSGEIDLTRPEGDPGLFAPDAVARRIHGDFAAMMIGGLSALLLQMLHPGALAGIWDHSDFRRDRLGRLRRTAQFIALTTFGGTDAAEGAIARVRTVHDRVSGTLPDGTPYRAHDPDLLAWVHVAETDSFLRAYLRYRDPALSGEEQDRYVAEVATIAERLGARDLPASRADIDAYYRAVKPALRFDHRTRDVADALLAPGDDRLIAPVMALLVQAGIDLLPGWAAAMHGRGTTIGRSAVRIGAGGVGHILRWALKA